MMTKQYLHATVDVTMTDSFMRTYQNLDKKKFISTIKDGCYGQGHQMTCELYDWMTYWGDNLNNFHNYSKG